MATIQVKASIRNGKRVKAHTRTVRGSASPNAGKELASIKEFNNAQNKTRPFTEAQYAKKHGLAFNKDYGDYGKVVGNKFHGYDLFGGKGGRTPTKIYAVPVKKQHSTKKTKSFKESSPYSSQGRIDHRKKKVVTTMKKTKW